VLVVAEIGEGDLDDSLFRFLLSAITAPSSSSSESQSFSTALFLTWISKRLCRSCSVRARLVISGVERRGFITSHVEVLVKVVFLRM